MKYLKKYRVIALLIALVAVWAPGAWAQAPVDVAEIDSVESETFNSQQFNKWKSSKKFVAGIEAYDNDKYADALKHFNAEVKAHPANGYAYCNISLCQDKIALDTLYESMQKLFANIDLTSDDIDDPDAFFENIKIKYVEIMNDAMSSLDKGISLLPAGDKESLSKAYLTRATFLDKFMETDTAEVVNSYKKAIEVNPNLDTYTKFIDFLVNNSKDEEANTIAIEAYNVLGEAQCSEDLLAMVGEAFRLNGNYDKAMEIANKVLSNYPTNIQSRETRSLLYNEQKNYSAYVDDIIAISNAGAGTGITSLLLDVIDADDGNWDMVIDKVHQAQANDDQDAKTNWYLVEGYLNIHRKGDYRTALDCFKKGAEYTYTSYLFTRIAECYYALGEVDNAMQVMDDAIVLYAKEQQEEDNEDEVADYRCLMQKVEMEMDCGLVNQVINDAEVYRIIMGDGVQSLQAYMALEWAYFMQGKYREALKYNQMWLDADDSNRAEIIYRRAYILYAVGHVEQAQKILRELLADESNFEYNQELKFNCLVRMGRTEEAKAILDKLVADRESFNALSQEEKEAAETVPEWMSLYNIACSYSMLGDSEKAIHYLRRHYEETSGIDGMNYYYTILDYDFYNIRQNPEYISLINEYKDKWLSGTLVREMK